ncbi:MAG TPA: hypothetical protein VFG35_32140 [Actinoplanes sp.]|nr:hypothetical protein [Actinoplanes sp.]
MAPLIAGFQALVACQSVPEWRTVLDAAAAQITVPVEFLVQWDGDVRMPCGLGDHLR